MLNNTVWFFMDTSCFPLDWAAIEPVKMSRVEAIHQYGNIDWSFPSKNAAIDEMIARLEDLRERN